MRVVPNLNLTIKKPWLLRRSDLVDQITILNLVYPGRTLCVCRSWYKKVVDKNLVDDIDFNLVIVNQKFNPPYPEL